MFSHISHNCKWKVQEESKPADTDISVSIHRFQLEVGPRHLENENLTAQVYCWIFNKQNSYVCVSPLKHRVPLFIELPFPMILKHERHERQ